MERRNRAGRDTAGSLGYVEIRGLEQLDQISRHLRAAGSRGKELRKQLLRDIREAAKPAVLDARESAKTTLPRRGGLAKKVSTGIGSRTRATGPKVGVRIVARNKVDIASLNRGRLRHPVFGNREVWVDQPVRPKWFDRPLEERQDEIRGAVLQAIDNIAKKLES